MTSLRLASWNINSIRIRQGLLQAFVDTHAPDVLCLQETKVEDAHFPHGIVEALGFAHCLFTGEKSYNGVAILSKLPLQRLDAFDLLGNGQKRHIAARLPDGTQLHNFYVPAGGDVADPALNPKFAEKLRCLDAMEAWSRALPRAEKVIAVGDFNIAPFEHDVWSSKQLRDVVSHTPLERERLLAIVQAGNWVDVGRHFVPLTEKLYSWWSYRNRDWAASHRGRRLDHLWVTEPLKARLESFAIFQEARGMESPSDHVPVMMDLAA